MRTKRWNEPVEPDDGCRILVTRYRPRGIGRDEEPWDAWAPHLGPSKALHAAAYGKSGAPIGWDEYRSRYLTEMQSQTLWIRALGERVRRGEPITLLCSSACVDPDHCHRSLLRGLIEAASAYSDQTSPAPEKQRIILRRRKV